MADITLEELKAQKVALVAAMRTGASTVRHGDKSVTYRSIDEMRVALEGIEQDIADVAGTKKKRVFYISAHRGL